MDLTFDLVRQIRPLLLDPRETNPFWAAYTEDLGLATRLLHSHPTLTIYTISCWGDEYWAHRGERLVNRTGCLLGAEDLGAGYAQLLWKDGMD